MTNRPIEIYCGNDGPDDANVRKVSMEGVLLPWWDTHGKEFPLDSLGKLIIAFHNRFGACLLPQFYADNREQGRVRFVMFPSESDMGKHMMSTTKIAEMSNFIVGFYAAVRRDRETES